MDIVNNLLHLVNSNYNVANNIMLVIDMKISDRRNPSTFHRYIKYKNRNIKNDNFFIIFYNIL